MGVEPASRTADDPARAAAVDLAKSYPYDVPPFSYALLGEETRPLVSVAFGSALDSEVLDGDEVVTLRSCAERMGLPVEPDDPAQPLLAYGSNASVQGLLRKFADSARSMLLPVVRAGLTDFDIVYSAHISKYGAIPATIQHCPGARTTVYVLLATSQQRVMLRKTEPNYKYGIIEDIDLRTELGARLSQVQLVVSRHELLSVNGQEVGVAAVATENRRYPVLTEEEVLGVVRDRVAPDVDLDEFILQNVADPELAKARTERIKETAKPFRYPNFRILDE